MFGEEIIKGVIDVATRFIPDPNQRAQFEAEYRKSLLDSDTQIAIAQNKVNEVEAGNTNLFISGWRPAAGWACVGGLVYQIMFRPIFGWFMINVAGWSLPPDLDIQTLMTLLSGLLGLGAYRMNEKIKGVASK